MYSLALIFDLIGLAVGLVFILVMLNLKRNIGGKVNEALNLIIGGVLSMMLAFGWTVIFSRLKLLPAPPLDIHHVLMTTGMVFFLVSARKLSYLSKI